MAPMFDGESGNLSLPWTESECCFTIAEPLLTRHTVRSGVSVICRSGQLRNGWDFLTCVGDLRGPSSPLVDTSG